MPRAMTRDQEAPPITRAMSVCPSAPTATPKTVADHGDGVARRQMEAGPSIAVLRRPVSGDFKPATRITLGLAGAGSASSPATPTARSWFLTCPAVSLDGP